MYRSTKGASKARRDQINSEIRNLKDLLPISDADKSRLSYLHIMSLACMYTRKSVFFTQDTAESSTAEETVGLLSFHELNELVQVMPGFLLLLTGEGKLLYLSDNVSEHLGHSMVDLVAQGDSVYDIIDPMDHYIMRSNLVPPASPDTDRLFRCRFNTSKSVRRQSAGNKLVLIRAHCLSQTSSQSSPGSYWTSNPVWVCFCAPLEAHTSRTGTGPETPSAPALESSFFLPCFRSQHSSDMRLQEAQDSVNVYLGLNVETLRSHSWYSFLHPQDLTHASAQHCSLLREGGEGRAEMVVRVETADHSWVWLYMVLQLDTGENPIVSSNFIISETEAWSVRQQLSSEQTQLSLVLGSSTSQQESLSLQSPETLSSPDQVFTPGSSGLSGQSFDFSTAACSAGSTEEQGGSSSLEPTRLESGPRSSLSSLEEESFFQHEPIEPLASPSSASSPIPVTVATVSDLDFLTQNILLPPSFQIDPPLPALPLPLPPVPTSQVQQTKEFVCTPPYTPQLGGSNFPFGEPHFSFDPTGATSPPPLASTATVTTTVAPSISPSAPSNPQSSPPPPTTTLSTLLPLTITSPTTGIVFPVEPCSVSLYEKLPPTPDSPGDGDCMVMTLPEVRGPLYVDVLHGPLPYPPEGLLTPEASPGKQPSLSFFSSLREREKERTEISLLAQHISTLAEGFYLDPLFTKLVPSTISPHHQSQSLDSFGLDSIPLLGEFYPLKSWKGLDLPIFPDDESLFEESILETLLQDLTSSPTHSTTPSFSSSSSPPSSPSTPECWCPPLHFDGISAMSAGHFCSVQSAHCNNVAGRGATMSPVSTGNMADGKAVGESAMETQVASSPLITGIPASPPLQLTASPASPVSVPVSSPVSPTSPGLPCSQSLLEELATLEPMFGAGASIAPDLGQQPELYQLQSHAPQQCFRKDGSGSDSPF
ncbi:neuronal PAS domain-containing protein 4A-like isoform X2 [Myxocyprinus asiaticus]|uniref:neuronal PAS domain-containing protein 4A-like isoform X2 n=1 Tax=Myxocyprinus asiaticus TaxID=70543 RepID=UPI002222CB07|nr:neuronal PAS domain-containing protein 4A-like isoform X2 [Myxocyprinus asiaticus]